MEKMKKKHPVIGLIIARLEENYQTPIWKGVADFAKEKDVNLIFFPGRAVSRILSNKYKELFKFDSQLYLIGEFINKYTVDGIIIITGEMSSYLSLDEISVYCNKFKPLPTVCISSPVGGLHNILVNNESGVIDAVNHLVKVHNYKKIVFIKGPENNKDAIERLEAYSKALSNNGIPFDEKYVSPGNFSPNSGEKAVELFFNKRKLKPDAIVAVDDDTVLGVYSALKKLGLSIPEDVAVTGFDNIARSVYMSPPLTTVQQPLYEQGRKAVESLLKIINGELVREEIIFPAKLIIRESCGCLPWSKTNNNIRNDSLELKNIPKEDDFINKELVPELTRINTG